jgi:hypothetical protein
MPASDYWLPLGVAAVGIGAALATGSGVASADDGSASASHSASSASSHTAKSTGPAKTRAKAAAQPARAASAQRVLTRLVTTAAEPTATPKPAAGAKAANTADTATTTTPQPANPVQDVIDGVVLAIRRTFFNQAPTVSPVQITGQHEGVITGSIGAVDPEGDPITYKVDTAPGYGTVAVNADGTYTYTAGTDFAGADTFTVTATDTGFHLNLLDLFRPAGTDASVKVGQYALGTPLLTFTFVYSAGADLWSDEAKNALQRTATDFSSYFVLTSPVNITFTVNGENLPASGVLAEGGSDIYSTSSYNQTVVQHKVLTGEDLNQSAADGEITWNFAYPWALGTDVPDDEYDFEAVATHELMHAMGFTSMIGVTTNGYSCGAYCSTYDSFIVTDDGVHPIGKSGVWNSAYTTNLTGGDGGLYFGGANAVAAYGGLVPLYTPSSYSGSSLSHLDGDTFTGADAMVMNPASDLGPGPHLSAVELGILEDLGYSVTDTSIKTADAPINL